MIQTVRFCSSADGTRIAYGAHGNGPPLVRVATWLTHLEYDWESPLWRHWLTTLADGRTLVRYDQRGCGLSERDVTRFSIDTWVEDLEAVVDAAGLDRFALLGLSNAAPVAVAYAARHPDRVSHLVLCGGFAQGRLAQDRSPQARAEVEAFASLIREGWGGANPAFRRFFTALFVPDATHEQMTWLDEMQRISLSAETAALIRIARDEVDVAGLHDRVGTPTLVMHAKDDAAVPFEQGLMLASSIADSQFVPLASRNHILLADEPAWPAFIRELNTFVPTRPNAAATEELLTQRELEILRCVADGMTNQAIAEALFLSVRTVERHLGNMYIKLGLRGRSGRAAIAARAAALLTDLQ